MIIKEFKEIFGFDGYFINEDGIILSSNVGTILKEIRPYMSSSGYYTIKIKDNNGNFVHKSVHRLVAETFIGNPYHLSDVNHIDSNKTNNTVENLEWCTRGENIQHFYNSEEKHRHKAKCELVVEGNIVGVFESIRQACRYVNDNIEQINLNAMSNAVRVGVRPYKGKYSVNILN